MRKPIEMLVVLLISTLAWASPPPDKISLSGPWRFELDRTDTGLARRWHERNLKGTIHLPGSLPAQGIGDDVTVDTGWTSTELETSGRTSGVRNVT
jgi:hypothetical protein